MNTKPLSQPMPGPAQNAVPLGSAAFGVVREWLRSAGKLTRFRGALSRIALYALLSILPLTIVTVGLERELGKEFQKNQHEQMAQLDAGMHEYLDPDIFHRQVRECGSQIAGASHGAPDPVQYLAETRKLLNERFPGCVELVIFDEKNQVVASCSDLKEFHDLLNQFGPECSLNQAGNSVPINEHLPKYRGFLGPYFWKFSSPSQIGAQWECTRVSSTRKRSLLYIPEFKPGNPWFILYFSFPREPRELIFQFMWDRKLNVPERSDIVDLNDPPGSWGKNCGDAAPFAPQALEKLGDLNGKTVAAAGFFWAQILVSPKKRLLMAFPDVAARKFLTTQKILRLSGAVCFLLMVCLPFLSKRFDVESLSLKPKLLVLFFYSTAIPLVLLFLSARGLFDERRQIMEKKLYQEQEFVVKEFNRGFTEYQSWLETMALKMRGSPLKGDADDEAQVRKKVQVLVDFTKPDFCEIFSQSGESLFHYARKFGGIFPRIMPMVGIQVARGIAQFNKVEVSMKDTAKEQAVRATIESLGFDVEEMAANFSGVGDTLTQLDLGGEILNLMNIGFLDVSNQVRYCAFFVWGKTLKEEYIKRRLAPFQRKLPRIQIGSRVGNENLLIPVDFPLAEKLPELDALVDLKASPALMKVEKEGITYLLSAMKGRQMDRNFYALSTDAGIRAELRQTAVKLWVTGFFLMFLGLGLGYLISENFLRPVELLSRGIEAIRKRDFTARIPILSQDEFGKLSGTFNQMAENMGDLEVAKIVQETFFPQEPLAGDGWEVFGTSVPASRVGGDYYDYFTLSDGRWLVLIGDVSGHGVPAALIVAMAKALVFHPANPLSPAAILDTLSLQIYKTLNGKRLMSCFLGIFDPHTGVMTAVNAGHNYPYLVQAGSAEEVNIRNPLLGTKIRKPYQEHTLSLGGAAFMCLYTDGLIEALDREEQQIGYVGFSGRLPHLGGATARDTEKNIREWFKTTAAPGPLADDITLVILQKSVPLMSPPPRPNG